MSIKNKILETEFPLTAGGSGANPKMRRSSSTKDPQLNSTSLNRQSSGSARKISANSTDLREPLMASEWQYESARSMSRIQTSFDRSGSVYREAAVQTNMPKIWKSNVRSASLNRTASLRKACSDESSDVDVDEEDSERSPLRPQQQADISTTTTATERPTVHRPTSMSTSQRPTTTTTTRSRTRPRRGNRSPSGSSITARSTDSCRPERRAKMKRNTTLIRSTDTSPPRINPEKRLLRGSLSTARTMDSFRKPRTARSPRCQTARTMFPIGPGTTHTTTRTTASTLITARKLIW